MTDDRVDAVPDEAVDALVESATEGLTDERLSAGRTEDGYRLDVGEEAHEGLSEAAFRAVARRHGAAVAEWCLWQRQVPDRPGGRAFLRWLEGEGERPPRDHRTGIVEDDVSRTWGELLVTADLADDGSRRYDVRHEADAGRPTDDLTVHRESAAVREITRFDDRGRYRPLKSAPTLADGWALVGLDPAGLLSAVESFYPASIANWHREREGTLDVTHWRTAAERQTGIYDPVDELEGDAVERLARACCVDSQCLKRRQWDESAEDELDVPRGDGEFPCREPCSLVIAAAREFVLTERDADRSVELALSDAEYAQLERIVAAVAEGEVEAVRDGDLGDGANRLRARYLRETLFED